MFRITLKSVISFAYVDKHYLQNSRAGQSMIFTHIFAYHVFSFLLMFQDYYIFNFLKFMFKYSCFYFPTTTFQDYFLIFPLKFCL